jgi:transposase-like protein
MGTITAEVVDTGTKRDRKGRKITPAPQRAELVAAYRASGLTMEQFAKQEGINRLTLAKWTYLQGRRPAAPAVRFAEMKLGLPLAREWAFEVTLPSGLAVRAGSTAALAELLTLVRR